jgi:hypothetical protein
MRESANDLKAVVDRKDDRNNSGLDKVTRGKLDDLFKRPEKIGTAAVNND